MGDMLTDFVDHVMNKRKRRGGVDNRANRSLGSYTENKASDESSYHTPHKKIERYNQSSDRRIIEDLDPRTIGFDNLVNEKEKYEKKMGVIENFVIDRLKERGNRKRILKELPQELREELDRLEDEEKRIENNMDVQLWHLARTYKVQTQDGTIKLFDLVNKLFKYANSKDIHNVLAYIPIVVPRLMDLVTTHVKFFEEYEDFIHVLKEKNTHFEMYVNDLNEYLLCLEEEREEYVNQHNWESRYYGLLEKYKSNSFKINFKPEECGRYYHSKLQKQKEKKELNSVEGIHLRAKKHSNTFKGGEEEEQEKPKQERIREGLSFDTGSVDEPKDGEDESEEYKPRGRVDYNDPDVDDLNEEELEGLK